MSLAYVALGSNQGARRHELARAIQGLRQLPKTQLQGVSRLYETSYQGAGTQRPYLNACLVLETSLSPQTLLEAGQAMERQAGRERDGHMKPRPLDVDLLLVDDLRLEEERLRLPHPRMHERRFVLQPLADLDPELKLPGQDLRVRQLLQEPQVQRQELKEAARGRWWEEKEE
ncbi:MAG TPA: 2-amino-4-hydroxy-6-hydroxymethyldihydropteridine diphosphokinase [Candidatus Krumholzibacteria bacterium]|nr:2-amino-4-hydroxy-6-hydroxymethyldihydropteridine diphosphokinase [Candidatus Krumholzibacteria bacterium]